MEEEEADNDSVEASVTLEEEEEGIFTKCLPALVGPCGFKEVEENDEAKFDDDAATDEGGSIEVF